MKLPAYPRTKPGGVAWPGDVPEHWEVKLRRDAITRAGDLRPKGVTILQPGATPRVRRPTDSSALKGRDKAPRVGVHRRDYAALSGLGMFGALYPGRCPGLDYCRPVGAWNGGQP